MRTYVCGDIEVEFTHLAIIVTVYVEGSEKVYWLLSMEGEA